jgi:hypothetical protein
MADQLVSTNQDTAYKIQDVLQAWYKNTEQWGLTTLMEKFNNVKRANQSVFPDIWFDSLKHYKEHMVMAGGSVNAYAETVAHVLASAPNVSR